MSSPATDGATVTRTDPTSSFDAAVGTAAQQQSARLREFFPQLSRAEGRSYRRLLERLTG